MQPNSLAPITKLGSDVLSRALGEPAVERLALALHINLQDPDTLNRLEAMVRQCVNVYPSDDATSNRMHQQASDLERSRNQHYAIRAYMQIAKMI
jgi:hypothetical protein